MIPPEVGINGPVKRKANEREVSYLAKMTIKDQFEALNDFKHYFNNCLVIQPKGVADSQESYIECERVTPIKKIIDYQKYFYMNFKLDKYQII